MLKSKTIVFLNKAIDKTANVDLHWSALTNQILIKPLPSDKVYPEGIITRNSDFLLDFSYFAPYKTGQLLLLLSSSNKSLFAPNPPDGCTISLRMQDSKSRTAVEIANSEQDPNIATYLLRLYNLIDKSNSSLKSLIDDFLDS